MSDINEARVSGRIVQQPRINQTQTGFEIGHVTLEVHETKYAQNPDGTRSATDAIALYQTIKVVGRTAIAVLKTCVPGDMVYAEGKLQYTSYNDQNGGKHEDKEIESRKFHKIMMLPQYAQNAPQVPQQPVRMAAPQQQPPQYAVAQTAPAPRQLSDAEEYAQEQYRRGTAPSQMRQQSAAAYSTRASEVPQDTPF